MHKTRKVRLLQLHRRIIGNVLPYNVLSTVYARTNGVIKNYNKKLEENRKQAYKAKI